MSTKTTRMLIFATLLVTISLQMLISANALGFGFDTTPPNIGTPSIHPSSPGPTDAVTVSVNVQDPDSPVKNVSIFYTTDNWHSVNRTFVASYNNNTQTATAQIPAQPNSVHVEYYITAYDPSGNRGVNNNNGNYYGYNITAQSSLTTWIVIAAAAIGSVMIGLGLFFSRRRKSDTASQSVSKA